MITAWAEMFFGVFLGDMILIFIGIGLVFMVVSYFASKICD